MKNIPNVLVYIEVILQYICICTSFAIQQCPGSGPILSSYTTQLLYGCLVNPNPFHAVWHRNPTNGDVIDVLQLNVNGVTLKPVGFRHHK
jgi:hypothetical protein